MTNSSLTTPLASAQAPAYTDLSALAKLKRGAGNNDPAAIRAVAQQFESLFTRMMLKSMRDAVGKDPMFSSDQEQMYQGMADDQLSVQLSKGKGLGLADMLVRQLQKMGVKGADAAAGASAAAAGATGASKAAQAYQATQRTTGVTPDAAKANFIQDLWPHAEQAGLVLGVDPRNLIAQAALETNWGQNMPQDNAGRSSNNLFGIKANDPAAPSVTAATQEFTGGVSANTTAQFKAYATPAQSFQDYVALLRNNPRYSSALNTGSNVQAFASGLQRGGYATDPNYANKIAAVANKVNHAISTGGGFKLASASTGSATNGTL